MGYEFQFLQDNKTLVLSSLSPNHKLMSYTWILKIKYLMSMVFGAKKKTCLVAKGFSQVEGIYFNETFSFVAKMEPNSNYACNCNNSKDLKMHQMDVQTNFLNGDLLDYIYIFWHLMTLFCLIETKDNLSK